jgi:hypothetical protein
MPSDQELEVLQALKNEFSALIPSGRAIAAAAVAAALSGHELDQAWIKENFSRLVESVQEDAYFYYLDAEQRSWESAFRNVFGQMVDREGTVDDLLNLISSNFYALDKFFLSRTNSRRVRAGIAFELLLDTLFTKLHYPFTPQPRIDGNPDFVLPSIEHYQNHSADAIVFTAKRTLRERWRQIVTEGARGLGFFLATIDEGVSSGDLAEMRLSRIYLVVPERMKSGIPRYQSALNVISFEPLSGSCVVEMMEEGRLGADLG